MSKYKVNFIYNDEKDLNGIFINVLKKELERYLKNINNTSSSYLTFKGEKIK